MKRLALILALVAGGFAAQAARPAHATAELVGAADSEVRLAAGGGRLVRLSRPAATVFVADPKIADVHVKSPTLVYVIGKAPGATSLFAVDAKEQMIANLGITVGFDETRLRGLLRSQSPDADIHVTSDGGAIVLTGNVRSEREGDDLLRIAGEFVRGTDKEATAGRVVNRLVLDAPDQINLQVKIVEVGRDATKELGVDWQSAVQNSAGAALSIFTGKLPFLTTPTPQDPTRQVIVPTNGAGQVIGGYHVAGRYDINTAIRALEEKNLVTVLAQPNLTARSGETASFLAGGEFPIPVPQGLNQVTVQFKQFGVSLAFVATILDGGRISLNVKPEVSELSSAGAITLNNVTIPALTTRRAETTVDLASGQSFAIAGLMQNNVTQNLSKYPGLGDLPVLGQLFRSKQFQRHESELVIIVTPYLVKPVSRPLATPLDHLADTQSPPAAAPVQAVAPAPETKG
ncbi:type II and III secretion system protein family protein [Phenylobacterium sp.]|uniref:type II and III secretion system protein family protein n=1 Tax=Phenylobacterium sp. TaxID=1871053 RepID=UPI002DF4946F|nr:type II and III secretion system protein family protein [Phenylobacterium sp.]